MSATEAGEKLRQSGAILVGSKIVHPGRAEHLLGDVAVPADIHARLQVSLEVCLNRDGDRIGTGRVDEVD
jgi:hypothetical protein